MPHKMLGPNVGKRLAVPYSIFLIFFLPATGTGQSEKKCPADTKGYTVSAIKVHTPFAFSDAVKKRIEEAINSAEPKLEVNKLFSSTAQTSTVEALKRMVTAKRGRVTVPGPLVLPSLVFSKVKGCDNGVRTLEVHFYVYSANYLDYLPSLFNADQDVKRAAPSTPLTRLIASVNPQPYVGYNRSRGTFGGMALASTFDNPVINEFRAEASGSASSATADAGFQGSRDFESKLMGRAEWKVGYGYSNVPSTSSDLRSGRGYGQFIGATKPAGKSGLVGRYGAAVEGGNRQTDLDPSLVPADILTSSRYSALKLFAGVVLEKKSQSFDLSYGFEAGNARGGVSVDYTKNIFDTGYSARFYPSARRPVTVDARFTAGRLNRKGVVPLATRFFGGNAVENFTHSDDWVIRSNPFIRSFPQNRFIPEGQTLALGGDKFASLNLTASVTAWGYPLVPAEVSDSKDFDTALGLQLSLSERLLYEQYLYEKSTPLKNFAANTLKLIPTIESLRETLKSLRGTFPAGSEAEENYKDTVDEFCNTRFSLNEVAIAVGEKDTLKKVCDLDALGDGRTLVWLDALLLSHKNEKSGAEVKSDLYYLSCDLTMLADDLKTAGAPAENIAKVQSAISAIESARATACKYACLKQENSTSAANEVGIDLASCRAESSSGTGPLCPSPCTAYVTPEEAEAMRTARVDAEQRAKEILSYSGQVIRRLAKKENLVAVGPVFMFDAARIATSSQTLSSSPTRYGVGVGGRLTIVSLDVTFGYSFNTDRRAGEPRGAFVFSFNVSDLLK